MSDKKYLVPQDMVKAAHIAVGAERPWGNITVPETRAILEAAIRWLAENPIVPTDDQHLDIVNTIRGQECVQGAPSYQGYVIEWQRRCFLSPKPEVPDAVKDLLHPDGEYAYSVEREWHDNAVIEAYRRGKAGK